ncbi:hypothetical protein YYC_02131 [Plasmodium yoelii 17X]|uniref:YIR protein n=1 Tax=Plasmodium yoelii 17X TaxID=1323249 RepID=V7PR70_PLAYE|nr:hypothetical protein YYC_02131 [Plasmodium yoelii 17X]
MNKDLCTLFFAVKGWFPDKLDSGDYQFIDDSRYKKYFTKDSYTDIDKINGWCLFLFNEIFMGSYLCEYCPNRNTNAVAYILAWLSYKLHQKSHEEIENLNDFYTKHIKDNTYYKKGIDDVTENTTYIELINKNNDFLNINFEYMSKFYEAFILLCNMYNEVDEVNPKCEKYLEYYNEFLKKYEELKKDSDINKDNSYSQMLSILSNDYDNLKSKCNNFSSLLTYSLISIAFIFVAIPIFWGISYKRKNKKYNEENDSLIYDSNINND